MTQHELAAAVEVPQPTIARIESGAVSPRASTLTAILEATGHRLAIEPIPTSVDREAVDRRLGLSMPVRVNQALGKANRDPQTSPIRIVRRLRRFGVPFVLVGELAEVAHGAPATAGRLVEICHATTDVAAERLQLALDDLSAAHADGDDWTTAADRLRLITKTAAGDDYEVLVRNAARVNLMPGVLVRLASIEDLIRDRRARGTAADRDVADVLRAVSDESLVRRQAGFSQ